MQPIPRLRLMVFVLALLASSLVCNTSQQPVPVEPSASSTPFLPAATQPENTQPSQPTQAPLASVPLPTTTLESVAVASTATAEPSVNGSQCLVLQDVNLRSGPGTAYRPPLAVVPINTVVIPTGYNPIGKPGGSWVLIQDPVSQQPGWVSAGSAYLSCNFDLTNLSPVTMADPQILLPKAQSSNEDGTCNSGETYDCKVILNRDALVQFIVLKNGQEIGQNDGVDNVTFTVTQGDQTIYNITESNVAYCIFGGNGPCNPWVLEDYVYKWGSGGAPALAGQYHIGITANISAVDENGNLPNLHWAADVTITLP
jgi:hypothetical protein